jgi:hypothetical protein
MEKREGRLVTRLWPARQLEENFSEVIASDFALAIGRRVALREEWAAKKG